uniref:Uncharacterized protein n=1 Tax=Anopheles minimus TaxID=112268 RepID=A0A182WP92_9DIPT
MKVLLKMPDKSGSSKPVRSG